ncbi:PREDICTED: short integuments 2, mitochondrial [Tarenaya hassleriana]|uniref:short integuments 2, mitochondrial n=1 Tax=Tarenaya hassleriana TaxID=28532 RepID=UPI00053C41E3|nr:PREDICTED: short integuments 2, mitochondrial [Tarenaya hassleriana]
MVTGMKKAVKKGLLGGMSFARDGGAINWFPGHMAAATRAIRNRLKLSDLVIEVRDARIPLSSANEDLQPQISAKRRVIALNKKDLANPNILNKWTRQDEEREAADRAANQTLSLSPLSDSLDGFKKPKLVILSRNGSRAILNENLLVELAEGLGFLVEVLRPDRTTELAKIYSNDAFPLSETRNHSRSSVKKLLDLVEFKLKEVIAREPTLLVMVLGVPNVGKSALINSVHQIAATRFPVQEKLKRATVGALPGVTQDIAGFKIAHRPSIYVLDTPGVLVPSIPDVETGLKLALAGSVKDSVVGEERIAQYFLALLNTRGTPLHWKNLVEGRNQESSGDQIDKPSYDLKDLLQKKKKQPDLSDVHYVEDIVSEVKRSLYLTFSEFEGDVEDENDLECLIEQQFEALQKALKVSHKASEARLMVSKKFLTLFRTGKLGPFILDDVPETLGLGLADLNHS